MLRYDDLLKVSDSVRVKKWLSGKFFKVWNFTTINGKLGLLGRLW